jgi:hypothetical protein
LFEVGRLAQLVEQLTLNQRVAGSSPAAPTIFKEIGQVRNARARKPRCFGLQ